MKRVNLLHGDCLKVLKTLADDSVDSIVTDPPYGISFMNKKWDHDVPGVDVWKECLRVLKPGGHMLVACGTRTQHRMVAPIEDAGFEIRDVITWLYGSGFPKSLNVGKATGQPEHEGLGTALKPAVEFWTLCRKPLSESTVAKNVLKHSTGGINVDGCRVESPGETISNHARGVESSISKGEYRDSSEQETHQTSGQTQGRFPANLILDEEAGAALDEQSGILKSGAMNGVYKNTMMKGKPGERDGNEIHLRQEASEGGASRFFYCAKASKTDRGEGNGHPTVKPTKLMEYLCRLITPPGGTVLDPFMGSGSTGVAALREGFRFTGIELSEEYFEICEMRIGF